MDESGGMELIFPSLHKSSYLAILSLCLLHVHNIIYLPIYDVYLSLSLPDHLSIYHRTIYVSIHVSIYAILPAKKCPSPFGRMASSDGMYVVCDI